MPLHPEHGKRETALFTQFARTKRTTVHQPSLVTITNVETDGKLSVFEWSEN